jgi:hypothetical protein
MCSRREHVKLLAYLSSSMQKVQLFNRVGPVVSLGKQNSKERRGEK